MFDGETIGWFLLESTQFTELPVRILSHQTGERYAFRVVFRREVRREIPRIQHRIVSGGDGSRATDREHLIWTFLADPFMNQLVDGAFDVVSARSNLRALKESTEFKDHQCFFPSKYYLEWKSSRALIPIQ